jgi:hypothetical protein
MALKEYELYSTYKTQNRHTGGKLVYFSKAGSYPECSSHLVYGKGEAAPCLINQALRHEVVWRSGGIAPPFLTSTLDAGE